MIVQSCDGFNGDTSISFTVPKEKLASCLKAVESLKSRYSFRRIVSNDSIAKLSVSGIGLRSHTSVAIGMFDALAQANINVQMISTSELRVNVVVSAKDGAKGLAALQEKFADNLR
jgi:aspartate kinase